MPGGKFENQDIHLKETAIRETVEELGLIKDHIVMVEELTDIYIPPSNFVNHLFVITINYQILPSQIAEIYKISIEELMVMPIIKAEVRVNSNKNCSMF